MQPCSTIRLTRVTQILTAVCVILLSTLSPAHETTVKLVDPGFRPDSEYTPVFLAALDTATIAVYPSVVHRADRTAVSFASRNMIVNDLNANNIATAITKNHRIDLGKLVGGLQWEVFEDSRRDIAAELTHQALDADYHFVMEFLLPRNNQRIFGVHVYLLDQEGRNAFSFLLNSHHKSFIDAQLFTDDSSEEARLDLIERATDLGLHALQAQIEQARICGTHTVAPPVIPRNSLIDGFESGLPAGTDRFGNALGFITFSDGPSTVQISTTTDYPALPPKTRANTVLRLNMNVNDWAGVVHIFENESSDQWVPQDWSALDELSFWFYGSNSSIRFFVDILDNRNICSTRDDAERYVYEFTDDFIGWERVFVPFKKLVRKETGNGAPNDGLTLSAVHGWAIGALNTGGSRTFYVDDVDVRKTSSGNIDYPINELPMYGGLKKTPAQLRADERYIKTITKGGRSREVAADIAAKTGWNLLYKGDDSSAIKRFNQAWLLDPGNQLALWGFAAISGGRNQINDAVRFFRMAIATGPENPALERDYRFALKQLEKSMGDAAP